jgi:hypothetical protein
MFGMQSMAMGPPPGDVKIVKCENCGADVTVNAAYPIESVKTCPKCPVEKSLRGYNAYTRTLSTPRGSLLLHARPR